MGKKITQNFSDKEMKLLEEQKELIKFTINKFEDEKFPKYISNYKQYLGYVLDRFKVIEHWQTNIAYPLASAIIDTEFANLFDFNYVFGVMEKELKQLCNQTFDYNSQGKQALKGALKECLICGEGYTRTGMISKTEKYNLLKGKKAIEVKTKKPSIDYISAFNVFYDDTHGVSKSSYQITRVFNTGEYIKNKYGVLFEDKKTDESNINKYIGDILSKGYRSKSRFSNYDYNPIKRINNFSNKLSKNIQHIDTMVRTITSNSQEGDIDQNNFFLVNDKKSYEIVEYTDKEKLTVYIDGTLLYHGTPLLDAELTLIESIHFNEIPGSSSSNGQVDNLSHLQDILDGIWNGFLDNMKMQLSGMFAVRGNVPALSRDGKIKFERFKGIKMPPDASIERIELGLDSFSPINVAQYMEGITEKRAGVNGYLLGGQSKVERVSDSINLIHNQYKSKLTPIIDSVQIMMGRVAKKWIIMYLKYFDEKQLAEKNLNIKVEKNDILVNNISVVDIINDENISFKFNSLRNIEKENKRGIVKEVFMQLIQMKQFNPNQIDELFRILLDEDFDLEDFSGVNFSKFAAAQESEQKAETEPNTNISQNENQEPAPQQQEQSVDQLLQSLSS